jgi:hypothetical protein
MFEIRRYCAEQADEWNRFVADSKNGTFLLDRNYMDYHADRFADHSLIVYHKSHPYALFPANQTADGTIFSHQGLTYGGLITSKKATVANVCEVFRGINAYYKNAGIKDIVYKAVPWIYHCLPAEEDLYALTNVCNAQLMARDISSTIILSNRIKFEESRRSGLRKAEREGLSVSESNDMAAFWDILNSNLQCKYGARPVHSLAEIMLLKSRFPDSIRLFIASKDGKAMGGTLIYITPQVVHTQYISASAEGKRMGALDLLFNHIINQVYVNAKYLDFGKSTEQMGHYLNEKLIFQKEGFGGRGVCYDWYKYEL